jgi:hypothetical protein
MPAKTASTSAAGESHAVACKMALLRSRPKVTPFAGGNGVDVWRNRCRGSLLRSRQKSRLLPAATQLMSAKIASCDFGQWN